MRVQPLPWGGHLDNIKDVFGATRLRTLERKGSKKLIRAWHSNMSATPRTANIALTVLVRLMQYGVDVEDLTRNPAAGIPRLDEGPGRASIVWSPQEFDQLLNAAYSEEAAKHTTRQRGPDGKAVKVQPGDLILGPARQRALRLAWLTGLRREDLMRLRWDEVDFAAGMIRRRALKSRRQKRIARINLNPDLIALLAEFRAAADAFEAAGVPPALSIVTTETGGVYASPDAFSKSLLTAFDAVDVRAPPDPEAVEKNGKEWRRELADLEKVKKRTRQQSRRMGELQDLLHGPRKHFHDIRGTRASQKFADGFTDAEAEIWFAWAPGSGGKMRGIYGDPETIAIATGKRLRSVA